MSRAGAGTKGRPGGALRYGLAALLALLLAGTDARAAEAPAALPQSVRVATGPVAPFVFDRGGVLSGFGIELWAAIAQRLEIQTRWVNIGPRTDGAQVAAVAEGAADLAISAIPITGAREAKVDFSLPYFDGGLQILVARESRVLLATFEDLLSPALLHTLAVGLGLVLVLGHVLWLVERRANPLADRGYLRGLGDGLWGVMLIISTGEHGDRETPSVVKRLTVAFMWLFGVVLIAQFTATVTSSLTVQQLRSRIHGPADLMGRTLGSVPGSVAAEYLQARGHGFVPVDGPEEAFRALIEGRVQAVVYEAPTLQYWASRLGSGQVRVTGPVFHPERYGIALPVGSPLRKPINAALLELMENGTYEEIRLRWFGHPG